MEKKTVRLAGLMAIAAISLLVLSACMPGAASAPTEESMDGSGEMMEVPVSIPGRSYDPKDLEVTVGTTVVWTNDDSFAHTVTADDGLFDSGRMNTDDTFSYTFDEPGVYPYYCVYHGGPGGVGQAGTVTVTGDSME